MPKLYGACVKKNDITYVVTEILGQPLCTGNGTDMQCALTKHMKKFMQERVDREYSTLLWLSKVVIVIISFYLRIGLLLLLLLLCKFVIY